MNRKLPVFALITVVSMTAGEFRTRLNKSEDVTLQVPHPAEVTLQTKALEIQYVPGQAQFKRQLELAQLIQQALSHQFEISSAKQECILQFSVIAYEPVTIQKQTVQEMRSVNAGSAQSPKFEERSVAVVYELIHGSIAASVAVSKGDRRVDMFQPVAQISRRTAVTVNGQAPSAEPKGWGDIFKTRSQPKAKQPVVETSESLETGMLEELATSIQRRYSSSTDPVEIALAVDPELRLGDKLAESGEWKEAFDSWQSASMRHNPSDRLYNLAVAKEALAYASYSQASDMNEFLPKFQESMDLYTQALHGDPSEKYMRQAFDRLTAAKGNIEAARRLKVEQDSALNKAMAAATEAAKQKKLEEAALADRSPDTPAETNFRWDVRTRLSDSKTDVSDSLRDQLIAFGERLKLSHLQSYRVVVQEIQRKKNMAQALQDYEDVFRPLAADGRITAPERTRLRELAKSEGLDTSEISAVESKYHFTESSSVGPSNHRSKPTASGPSN